MSENPALTGEGKQPDRDTFTGPPRWVKISALIAGILLLVVVAVMIFSGGEHGPGRHGFGLGAPESSANITAAAPGSGLLTVFTGQK
ncbi:hypothetical protein IG195_20525 (plasmid) [Arthrobacter sp. TES]|uniref:hypothetical protein n=1 Tax=Paenarthrobacter ureafaciens TaxID=37931 RepID=UPI000397E889|nr:hypothetical protein [Paenarthrobacter ureafaciens]AOY73832.1 hypothetical protein ARZXY2_4333 [Arthrobacter sp. ZXY-2]ERI38041.1 hypothetical protein M707_08285 [Arthrobacter sp. AK-YN10]QOI65754.1 hypothetical protein IG195_20525 [Arthrobacter sp. TES]GLU61128.1 hypothetical protein Pure01_36410 [Paenarthrobacter ureafaciens]GLU65397.1 hypothetical protein Pure02_36470 [Paenarthrobacter ureafaciens]